MDLGSLLSGSTGMLGNLFNRNQQSQAYNDYYNIGAPYRTQLQTITNDPSQYFNSPEAQALANASDRRYSASVGNPAGSGTAQAGAMDALLRGYGAERDRLFNYGGGAYYNRAAPGARAGTQQAGQGAFGSLQDLLAVLGKGGMFSGGGGGGSGAATGASED